MFFTESLDQLDPLHPPDSDSRNGFFMDLTGFQDTGNACGIGTCICAVNSLGCDAFPCNADGQNGICIGKYNLQN